MKQTAVDWLVEQMIERKFFAKDTPLSYTTFEHLINQAKAMEKEQIIEALMTSEVELLCWGISAEKYYKITFKNTNNESNL